MEGGLFVTKPVDFPPSIEDRIGWLDPIGAGLIRHFEIAIVGDPSMVMHVLEHRVFRILELPFPVFLNEFAILDGIDRPRSYQERHSENCPR